MVRVGSLIRIITMDGESHYDGREGRVTYIDDAGQLHGSWGGLALIPHKDKYEILEE